MPFASASARRMARAYVLFTLEGASQTSPARRIKGLDARIGLVGRELLGSPGSTAARAVPVYSQ